MTFLDFLRDPFVNVGIWFHGLLVNFGLPDVWVQIIFLAVGSLLLAMVPLVSMFFLIWYERKIVARIGDRLGPNNSGAYGGPYGLFQVFADAIKMFTKEDVIPDSADYWVFNIAPIIVMATAVLVWAVIPLGKGVIGADINIGVFFILAVGAGGIVSILMAGWSSNNKYSLLAALRGVATLIGYEVPQALAVMGVVMAAGSFSLQEIVAVQDVPFLLAMPIPALLFLASLLAELGRRPFDLVEADSEIVAGYFIEYSGMKFGMFYLAEFMNQLMVSALFSTLFLAGWRGPGAEQYPLLGPVWLAIKTLPVMLVIQFMQYTLPRLRIDQILTVNWKFITPLALVTLSVLAVVGKLLPFGAGTWGWTLAFLLANLFIAAGALILLALAARRARKLAAILGG